MEKTAIYWCLGSVMFLFGKNQKKFKNLISCEWVLYYHPSQPFCFGSSLILSNTAWTDDCGPSKVQRLGPKSKQTLVKQHVLGQTATQPLSLLISQALMTGLLYLILGHLECNSTAVTRLYH